MGLTVGLPQGLRSPLEAEALEVQGTDTVEATLHHAQHSRGEIRLHLSNRAALRPQASPGFLGVLVWGFF